jgi:hypothetical protein
VAGDRFGVVEGRGVQVGRASWREEVYKSVGVDRWEDRGILERSSYRATDSFFSREQSRRLPPHTSSLDVFLLRAAPTVLLPVSSSAPTCCLRLRRR